METKGTDPPSRGLQIIATENMCTATDIFGLNGTVYNKEVSIIVEVPFTRGLTAFWLVC